jgi:GT2 family glycosyltransferase
MTPSTNPPVTIIVVPREKFSCSIESLDSIIEHTEPPFELIYVDAGSPPAVRDAIAERCERQGFKLIRVERFLPTNRARNVALKQATGKYVVFVENDVVCDENWLPPLVDCAEATGATVVSPLICQGTPVHTFIHCAGGRCGIREETVEGRLERHLYEHIAKQKQLVSKVLPTLERKPTELAEFHAMMIRKDYLDAHGALDPNVLNTREHVDFCIDVLRNGGSIWLEPKSIVTYLYDTRLHAHDVPFFMYRWSDQSERSSLLYLRDKWDLTIDKTFRLRLDNIGWRRRQHMIRPMITAVTRGAGGKMLHKVVEAALVRVDRLVNRAVVFWQERKPVPESA